MVEIKETGHVFSKFDTKLFSIILFITLLGLLNLFSATYLTEINIFYKQCVWITVSLGLALLLSIIDYRIYESAAYPLYILNTVLLVAVLIVGRTIFGSRRWLDLGAFNFQPSELTKLAIVFVLARYFSRSTKHTDGYSLFDLIPAFVLTAVPLLLIFKEPDLGTALLIAAISGTMIFYAKIKLRSLILLITAFALIVPLSYTFVLKDYQKERIQTFLNPNKDPLGDGYHTIQSIITIGSGRFLGKTYLKGTQSKLEFIPKHSTDFIFSAFAEEWGFVGCLILLAAYFAVFIMGLNIAMTARDKFGSHLAIGLLSLTFWQVIINVGMELGLLPVVGITLPLFSYGGSSMLIVLLSTGILLNISSRRFMF